MDEKILNKAAKMFGGSFYLVPISCHEWQLESVKIDLKVLQDVVRNTNIKFNGPGDILSDNIYGYNAEEGRLFMVTGRKTAKEQDLNNLEEQESDEWGRD